MRSATNGFSLVELVLVIIVIVVLAVFIGMNWRGSSINLGAQAHQLASDLRYTQALSMSQGQRYCLKIGASSYQVINSVTNTAVSLALGSTVNLGTGISFGAVNPSGTVLFIFDGKGAPYSSTNGTCDTTTAQASTALTSEASISLLSTGDSRTVLITPETGRVTMQ